jgi:hypothetical protein
MMGKVTETLLARIGNKILSCLPSCHQGYYLGGRELSEFFSSKDIPGKRRKKHAKVRNCLLALEKMGYVERNGFNPIEWKRTKAGTEYLDTTYKSTP